MSEANQKTLDTYNGGVQQYIDGTPQVVSGSQKEWIDAVFADVPQTAKILEIGSGFGRDAQYLMNKGYRVDMTDASTGFLEYLWQNGLDADRLDIVNQRPREKYDVVLASAVFLHFTDEDFDKAVTHVRESLEEGGKFAFSVKEGEGEKWTDEKHMGAPRYFNYWTEEALRNRLAQLGMRAIVSGELGNSKWIHAVAEVTS